MNRRSFLQALAALGVVPLIPQLGRGAGIPPEGVMVRAHFRAPWMQPPIIGVYLHRTFTPHGTEPLLMIHPDHYVSICAFCYDAGELGLGMMDTRYITHWEAVSAPPFLRELQPPPPGLGGTQRKELSDGQESRQEGRQGRQEKVLT